MTAAPIKPAPTEHFSRSFTGALGVFKTSSSRPLFCIQYMLDLKHVDQIEFARDYLGDDKEFEKMIQREINPQHVADIEQYLNSSAEQIRILPPLLVAIVPTKQVHGSSVIQDYINAPERRGPFGDQQNRYWDIQWGKSFCLRLLEEADDGLELRIAQESLGRYLATPATLMLNPDNCAVIVVDGQHRLNALIKYAKRHPTSDMQVPICAFFPPEAYREFADGSLKIHETLRQVFVDINGSAKGVSGHFLVLLNDRRISSMVIRQFASNLLQSSPTSRLWLLDWLEWEAKKADQLTLIYKITNVSILKSCLEQKESEEYFRRFSGIETLVSNLEPSEIFDLKSFSVEASHSSKELILRTLVTHTPPVIEMIYSTLSPYKEMIAIVNSCLNEFLQSDSDEDTAKTAAANAILNCREADFKQIRRPDGTLERNDTNERVAIQLQAFREKVDSEFKGNPQTLEPIFRNNYAQQAIWRALFTYCTIAWRADSCLSFQALAQTFIESLNASLFSGPSYFHGSELAGIVDGTITNVRLNSRPSRLIKKKSVIVTLRDFILAHAADPTVIRSSTNQLEEAVRTDLEILAEKSAVQYCEAAWRLNQSAFAMAKNMDISNKTAEEKLRLEYISSFKANWSNRLGKEIPDSARNYTHSRSNSAGDINEDD